MWCKVAESHEFGHKTCGLWACVRRAKRHMGRLLFAELLCRDEAVRSNRIATCVRQITPQPRNLPAHHYNLTRLLLAADQAPFFSALKSPKLQIMW